MQNKYNQALRYEIFEKEEYACAKGAIQRAKVIFDIGGHLGYFSEWCRSLGSKAEIHYFEPVPFLYQGAKERLKEDINLICTPLGIGAKEEEISFLVNEEKTMQSSKYSSFLNPKGESIKVAMRTLESYLKEQNLDYIDLVKMDIEGMEFEVLESWDDKLLEKIGAIVMEVHLFGDEQEKRFEKLKEKLNQYFAILQEEVSNYTDKVRLVYCDRR